MPAIDGTCHVSGLNPGNRYRLVVLGDAGASQEFPPVDRHAVDFDAARIEHPEVDLQVVRLGLDFDADTDRLALLADDQAGL